MEALVFAEDDKLEKLRSLISRTFGENNGAIKRATSGHHVSVANANKDQFLEMLKAEGVDHTSRTASMELEETLFVEIQ